MRVERKRIWLLLVVLVVVVLQPAFAAAVPAHKITDLPLGSTEIVVDVPEVVGSTETTCWAAIAVAELRPDAAITVTEVTLRANDKKMVATIGKTVSSILKPVRRLKDIETQGSSAATYSEQRLLDTEVAENIAYAIVEFRPCDLDPELAAGGTLPLTFEATVVEGSESRVIVEQRSMLIQAQTASFDGWVRGDGHVHTHWSDAWPWVSPEWQAKAADIMQLDWIAFTDHTWDYQDDAEWLESSDFKAARSEYLAAEMATGVSVIVGEEIAAHGTGNGHLLAYDVPRFIPFKNSLADSVGSVLRAGAVGVVAHPNHLLFPWDFSITGFSGLEVLDPFPFNSGNRSSLDRLDVQAKKRTGAAAMASTDSHDGMSTGSVFTWVYTGGDTSSQAVVDGIAAGRTIASDGPLIDFTVKGERIGDVISARMGEKATVEVSWPADTVYSNITLVTNGERIGHYVTVAENWSHSASIPVTFLEDGYLRLEAVGDSGEAYTSPLYFDIVGTMPQLDLVFVVDTTGSMWDDIWSVKQAASSIVDALDAVDCRVAIVDYRDFPQWPYGGYGDYAFNDVLGFTADSSTMYAGIQRLSLGWGADWRESVYSGLMHAIDGTSLGGWRPQPNKVIILMGDAPPHDPEPYTGYVVDDILRAAYEADPISIYPILIGGDPTTAFAFQRLAEGSNGQVFFADDADDVANALLDAIGEVTSPDSVEVSVDIKPETLNLGSNGENLMVHITFPPEFVPGEVEVTGLTINGVVGAIMPPDGIVRDGDGNRRADVVVQFSRADVEAILNPGDQTLVVTGTVDGRRFSGQDAVNTIDPSRDEGFRLRNE